MDQGLIYLLDKLTYRRKLKVLLSEIRYNYRLFEFINIDETKNQIVFLPFHNDVYKYLINSDFNFSKLKQKFDQLINLLDNLYIKIDLVTAYWLINEKNSFSPNNKAFIKNVRLNVRMNNIKAELDLIAKILNDNIK